MPRFDYKNAFRTALNALPNGGTTDLQTLFSTPSLPAVTVATKRKHLRDLIEAEPALLDRVVGFYPKVGTVIDLVETRHGPVTETRLDQANDQCRQIVERIALPVVHGFVQSSLAAYIHGADVAVPLADLMRFLLDDFADFNRGAGNGLVSIAGGMNEALLMRAMTRGGLRENVHFKKTGTDSDGDFIVHSTGGNRDNLGVEVKSYHARERLLRGLQDITGPKVGAGFFKEPSEFNAQRTRTLRGTGAAAIYMPRATLTRVDAAALAAQTTDVRIADQCRLYRPLEQFVSDMGHFNRTGELPRY